ncbi:MAG: MmcQ/YjbR family DNA-binding protein [Clostridia bacterium]|nr:MmcQ/YjbR family DNA-binding protein [Clostridia bacterium]
MTREDVFDMVNEMIGATMDQPFEGDFYSTVLRHADTKKWFGIVMKAPRKYFYGDGQEGYDECVTLKCDPILRGLLQNTYLNCVFPAYHMNKNLWASLPLDSAFPQEEMRKLLYHSFDLTGKTGKIR